MHAAQAKLIALTSALTEAENKIHDAAHRGCCFVVISFSGQETREHVCEILKSKGYKIYRWGSTHDVTVLWN